MNTTQKRISIKRIALIGIFTAIALTIFVIEAQIPLFMPGVKLGLANIITLYIMVCGKKTDAFIVQMLRILIGSLFTGNMLGLLYSLGGGIISFFAMLLTLKICGKGNVWFVSIIGGISHNIGQVAVALAVMQTKTVLFYFPPLILSGIITGLFTGLIVLFTYKRIGKAIQLL